jgi:hypothetical protein
VLPAAFLQNKANFARCAVASGLTERNLHERRWRRLSAQRMKMWPAKLLIMPIRQCIFGRSQSRSNRRTAPGHFLRN